MSEPPLCRRCGKPHWRFVRCDRVIDRPVIRRSFPDVPPPEGFRVWTERYEQDGNVLYLRKDTDDGPQAA